MSYMIHTEQSFGSLTNSVGSCMYLWQMFVHNHTLEQLIQCALKFKQILSVCYHIQIEHRSKRILLNGRN